jgi:hypothetical protein
MDTGELLTRWSAFIAFLLYVLALALRRVSRLNTRRVLWTLACSIYLLHVVCAFQFVHHWSHTEAYAATARQTAEVVGIDWGGGLYLNYFFTLLWTVDVCWWWLDPQSYAARSRLIHGSSHAFIGFMWFNATVVFGSGLIRWLSAVAWLLLAGSMKYISRSPKKVK